MPWIESHDDIWEHHKLDRLCELLEISDVTAVGHLHALWHFTLRNSWRTASLKKWGDRGIERASRWHGKPGIFVKALRRSGWLDGFVPHGWLEKAGRLVEDRLRKEQKRVQEQRRTSPGTTADGSGTNGGQVSPTVPYRTGQDRNPLTPLCREGGPDGLAPFLRLYPQKRPAKAAAIVWKELTPSRKLTERIMKSLQTQLGIYKPGDFPAPDSWLRGAKWDESSPRLKK